ncbi:MAG: F-box protein [Candidatus Protochlamydia sp.]|nr:F-box protein [Candidatus Protochlamydia sp.]
MQVFNRMCSYFKNDYSEVMIPEVQIKVEEIEKEANNLDFAKVWQSLNGLCGLLGHVEINQYKDHLQVHLFFGSDSERASAIPILSVQCEKYKVPCEFKNWQKNDTDNWFSLLLSTNQSVALLGKDSNWTDSFAEGQFILQETKKVSALLNNNCECEIMKLNSDIKKCVLSLLPIKDLLNFSQTHKNAYKLLEDKDLWKMAAIIQNIQLNSTVIHPKEQIKNFYEKVFSAVVNLPKSKDTSGLRDNFVYKNQNAIEDLGGICLTPDRYDNPNNPNYFYEGIVIYKDSGKFFLHLCPGGGYAAFTKSDFDKLMPIAIKKLRELAIIPDEIYGIIGRHSGNTYENFVAWQNEHRKF